MKAMSHVVCKRTVNAESVQMGDSGTALFKSLWHAADIILYLPLFVTAGQHTAALHIPSQLQMLMATGNLVQFLLGLDPVVALFPPAGDHVAFKVQVLMTAAGYALYGRSATSSQALPSALPVATFCTTCSYQTLQ
jgi:hypothetical protein